MEPRGIAVKCLWSGFVSIQWVHVFAQTKQLTCAKNKSTMCPACASLLPKFRKTNFQSANGNTHLNKRTARVHWLSQNMDSDSIANFWLPFVFVCIVSTGKIQHKTQIQSDSCTRSTVSAIKPHSCRDAAKSCQMMERLAFWGQKNMTWGNASCLGSDSGFSFFSIIP